MIGAVVTLPIDAEDRLCIVLDMKSYKEFGAFYKKDMKMLMPGSQSYWTTNTPYLYRDRNPMCYELMYGDKKVWFLGHILLKE